MVDTNSKSHKPGIKRYVGDNMLSEIRFYDTVEDTLGNVRKLTEREWLWTGEFVYCICTHHVEQHCTVRDKYGFAVTIHCHGDNELCNCEHFRTKTLRIAKEEEVI